MAEHYDLGKNGESYALDYLTNSGYRILDTNWYHQKKELDIIAFQNNTVVIVEVKTRTYTILEEPKEAVTKQKQRNIVRAANAYVNKRGLDYEVRFDIIEVICKGNNYKISHIQDAFYPCLG